LRRPPEIKPATTKPARIPVKQQLVPVSDDTTQTVETIRPKTPREFSTGFLRFIDKLKEFHWFEEQYPLMKMDVSIIF
jgi:hypothetical protein